MMNDLEYLKKIVNELNEERPKFGRQIDWIGYRVKFENGVTEQNIRNVSEQGMREIRIVKSVNSIVGYVLYNKKDEFLSNLENVEKVGNLNDPSTY